MNSARPFLLRGLGGFDRASLREGAAALALWPKNADRHFALQALIDTLGSEPEASGGSRDAGAAEWAAWLAGERGKALQEIQPDGFHDAPIAVEATVMGTCQMLLAGQLEFPALHYRLWMEALAEEADSHLRAGRELLTAATSLCSMVVGKAQIAAHKWPDHRRPSPIAVPPEEEFEWLRAALRIEFDDPEIPRILAPLQRGTGTSSWRPLSRETESLLLIADPWRFSLAALVRSLDLAARSPQWATVVTKVRNAALAVAVEAAKEMEWTIESVEEEHLVARADVDCRVVIGVGVLSPDPAQREAESLSADTELAAWQERIASRARSLGAAHSLLAVIGDGRAVFGDDSTLRASAGSDPWIVGLGELQTIGEALRLDPLGLPVALSSLMRPPWPENFDLLDGVGMVRQGEQNMALEGGDGPRDGTEYMLARSRVAAGRHPAVAPGLTGWIEVTRWKGIEDKAIYCSRERDDFALLVRGVGRYIWVTCPGALERRYDLLPVVASALSFWLARLVEAGFPVLPAAVTDPLYIRFRLELDRRPGPHLAFAAAGTDTRIVLGPGFVEALCHGNNDADRMLVGAILASFGADEGKAGPCWTRSRRRAGAPLPSGHTRRRPPISLGWDRCPRSNRASGGRSN